MLKFKSFCTVFLCAVLVFSAFVTTFAAEVNRAESSSVEGSNLVINSSFEDTRNWSFGSIYRTNDRSHTGSYSAKTSVRGQSVVVCTTQSISVNKNTDYLLSGYIYRADNSTWGYIDLNDIPGEVQLLDVDSYGEWVYVSGVWNSGSNTSINVRMVVEPNYSINQHLKEGITGDVWFDDIELTPVYYDKYSEEPPVLSGEKKEYSLENNDIKVSIATDCNKEYLTEIVNKSNGYNWINSTAEVPLPEPLGNNNITWTLTNTEFDNSKSLKGVGRDVYNEYKFTYKNTSPSLTLYSYWRIYPTGPIYHFSEIENNSGADIVFNANDISSSDILLKVPDNTDVYRFNRSRYNNGSDGLFTTGVLKTPINTDMFLKSTVENSWLVSSGSLPFEMLHSDSHGLYIGFEWSYGQMLMQTQDNDNILRFSADLGYSSDSITRQNGEKLTVPPVFFGAYSGNTDDGSNNMKKWFYNHFMTDSLRENENEPYVEFHVPVYSENDLKNYINNNDLEEYGVEMTKMDYWWTVPGDQFDAVLEQTWNPDKSKWPNGMTYGKLIKNAFPSLKTSLYMCDTYQGVDIGTKAGQQAQINALTERLNNWSIDCWRSDFDLLKPNNYENHEGLMNILDTMIANNSNFRYEHCSAGGSLKDFATLQRMTFMTMEDSGGALNHRMAFYANSYMINPVQLKFDLGFDWTSDEDSGYIYNNQQKWTTYNVRTAMMGAMMVQNVSSNLTAIQKSELIKGWELYKTRQRPILKGADIYHILPMPDGRNWDGIEFYNDSIDKGSVFLFRDKNINSTDGSSKNIKLQGLEENALYSLEFQDRTPQNTVMTGYELMNNGITVSGMNSVYDSEIIWIEKKIEQETTAPSSSSEPQTTASSSSSEPQTTAPSSSSETQTTAPPTSSETQTTAPTSSSESQTTEPTTLPEPTTEPGEYVLIGDADMDGEVNINDVTCIQKYLASIFKENGLPYIDVNNSKQFKAADYNRDGTINIKDATRIQIYLISML